MTHRAQDGAGVRRYLPFVLPNPWVRRSKRGRAYDGTRWSSLTKDEYYSRADIGEITESNALIDYLTRRTRERSIASAILREDTNLAPPDVILVGNGPRNIDLAAQFCAENKENPVPVFVKEKDAPDPKRAYRCHGWFVVSHWVTSSEARRRWGALSDWDNLTRVIFLKEVDCESTSR